LGGARLADVRPGLGQTARQLADGLRALAFDTHPWTMLTGAADGLWRHGMTPTAAVLMAASAWGDRAALTDGLGTASYRQLAVQTLRWGAALAAGGWVRPGSRVALVAPDDRRLIAGLAAACWAGGQVSLVNPRLGADDARGYFAAARVDTLLGPAQPGHHGPRLDLDDLDRLPLPVGLGRSRAKSAHFVMLTGGTTGAPRGITIRRRWTAPLAALGLAGATGVRHGVPILICAPLFHGYGLAAAMLGLVGGSPLILPSHLRPSGIATMDKGGATTRVDWGEAIAATLTRSGVGTVFGAPAHFRSLAAHLDRQAATPPLRGARLISGADRLDPRTAASLAGHGGTVVNYYGTTETGTVTMAVGRELDDHPGTVGRPVAGSRVQIVDALGRTLPRGVPGRVRLFSPLASLSDPGSRGHTTADNGLIDQDGFLFHLGRADGATRLNGEFVQLDQITAVLNGSPGVVSARVWLSDDQSTTLPGPSRVLAEAVVRPDSPVSPEALRALVLARLGPAAQPARVTIITADA
jgi:fatty-acyl-CoA synthase